MLMIKKKKAQDSTLCPLSLGIIRNLFSVLFYPITGSSSFVVISGKVCHGLELRVYDELVQVNYEQFLTYKERALLDTIG